MRQRNTAEKRSKRKCKGRQEKFGDESLNEKRKAIEERSRRKHRRRRKRRRWRLRVEIKTVQDSEMQIAPYRWLHTRPPPPPPPPVGSGLDSLFSANYSLLIFIVFTGHCVLFIAQ